MSVDGAFALVEAEIQAEKVAALARIAQGLEDLIAELHRLAAVPEAAAAHARVRARALRQRWYLEVQREALGLFRHEGLDATYPIPGPLRPAEGQG